MKYRCVLVWRVRQNKQQEVTLALGNREGQFVTIFLVFIDQTVRLIDREDRAGLICNENNHLFMSD